MFTSENIIKYRCDNTKEESADLFNFKSGKSKTESK